jgi:DNA-binding PadR family transcriptional regulator
MDSKDWLLLFIAAPADKTGEVSKVDPIRIMKGMFYFTKESLRSDIHEFQPYHLGPVSFAIYKDLDDLVAVGFVAVEDVPGETWKRYYVTSDGVSKAKQLETQIDPALLDALREQKRRMCSFGFLELLRKVYKDYPDFASKSIFRF